MNYFNKILLKNFSKKIKNFSKRFEKYQYKPEKFNPKLSKYTLNSESELRFSDLNDNKSTIPKYISSDKKSLKEKKKFLVSGKRLRPGKKLKVPQLFKNAHKPLEKQKEKQKTISQNSNSLVPLSNNIDIAQGESSINRHDENYIKQEKLKRRNEIAEMKKLKTIERSKLFNPENLIDFQNEERLSKRLARLGVCSRRQAEKYIQLGMVKVNGDVVKSNVPVTDQSHIQIYSEKGYKAPMDQNTRIWIYYKPVGYVCAKKDEFNRPSVFNLLEKKGTEFKHFIIIGPLDINSEGLLVLTNNGDVAKALENNDTVEREYKVRVFGRMFNDLKLEKIRTGVNINMKRIKFWAEVITRQSTNTWLNIKSFNNSIVDIRNIFRKLSLRVNRIIRVRYGPFTLRNCKNPNDMAESVIPRNVNNYLYYHYKDKVKSKLRKLDDTKLQLMKDEMLHTQRIQKTTLRPKEERIKMIQERKEEKALKSVLLIQENNINKL